MTRFRWLTLISVLLLIAAACGTDEADETTTTAAPTTTTTAPTTTTEALPEGDLVNGGLMYDKWWTVVGADEPTEDQALWATQSENTRTGGDTWRCKECHGWDYQGKDGAYASGSHYTGFAGVFGAKDKSAAELTAAMTSGDHDFSALLSEQQIADLVAFLREGMEDYNQYIDDDKMVVGSDLGNGGMLYTDTCVACHGADGTTINFGDEEEPEYIGGLALGNPWETFHKVRFGHPGSNPAMPSAVASGWSLEDVRDVVAYSQTLPLEALDTDAVTLGGLLYDKWWTVVGADEPTEDSAIWALQTTNTRSGGDTWRCKECHGWDYKGSEGAYGTGSHFTGFPGVFQAMDKSADEIVDALTGQVVPDHDFTPVLNDEQIEALVAFITTGLIDMGPLFDLETKAVTGGDAAVGAELYAANCSVCHGDDGTALNFGDEDEPEYVGGLSKDNPFEVTHKILFGHPGSNPVMPAQIVNGWGEAEILDILAFLQTLP